MKQVIIENNEIDKNQIKTVSVQKINHKKIAVQKCYEKKNE